MFPNNTRTWLTTNAVAEYIGVDVSTIRYWKKMKFIPFVQKGRVLRFHRGLVDGWMLQNSCQGRDRIRVRPATTVESASREESTNQGIPPCIPPYIPMAELVECPVGG